MAQNGNNKRKKTRMKANAQRANTWWDYTHLKWYLFLIVGAFLAIIGCCGVLWFVSAAIQFVANAIHVATEWVLVNLWVCRVGLLVGLAVVIIGICGIVGVANVNELVKIKRAEADRRKELEIRRRIAAENIEDDTYGN